VVRRTKRANDWTKQKFAEYGLTNVHLESPGPLSGHGREARRTHESPRQQSIRDDCVGGVVTEHSRGSLRASRVLRLRRKKEYEKFRGKLKGAIVIYQEPTSLSPQQTGRQFSRVHAADAEAAGAHWRIARRRSIRGFVAAEKDRDEFWKAEGVAAVLRDSRDKPHGLLNMTDVSLSPLCGGLVPAAFITGEGYRYLAVDEDGPVSIEIEMTNSFGNKPVEVYNTVAELRGVGEARRNVIIGGHLDSWDLGTGSTDNGTGSMAVLEAARALSK